MKLLFLGPTYVGDAAMATGILAELCRRYPAARATVACGKVAAPLFAALPNLDRLLPIVKRGRVGHWLDLWRDCVGTRWDLVVDLRGSAFAWCVLAGQRRVFRPDPRKAYRTQALAATIGFAELPPPVMWTGPSHDAEALRLLPPGPPVLALGPTGNRPAKIWPAERFAELARRLTGPRGPLPGGRVVVLAAPHEREIVRPLLDGVPPERMIDLVGRVDLTVAGAVLKRADFFAGNDTGPLFMALGAGIPALGLFGPTPGPFGPPLGEQVASWAPKAGVVRTRESVEELNGSTEAERMAPGTRMESLTVDAVEAAAVALLRRVGSGAAGRNVA
ncbi:MAG: glycosyltransferase family 9 protein [Proteobacteria bacterium]|nr:glycosyltransferase family 9 protein [Pseudomonadota bacterium]